MSEKTWTKTEVEAIVLKALETYRELYHSWFSDEEAMSSACQVAADILDGKAEL